MVVLRAIVRVFVESGLGCGKSFRSVGNVMLRVGQCGKVADYRVGRRDTYLWTMRHHGRRSCVPRMLALCHS